MATKTIVLYTLFDADGREFEPFTMRSNPISAEDMAELHKLKVRREVYTLYEDEEMFDYTDQSSKPVEKVSDPLSSGKGPPW